MGALLVLAAVVMAVLFGRELVYELEGGGTPGTLAVERCDSRTEREHRPSGGTRKERVYRCQGTFTGEDGKVTPGVEIDIPGDEAPGDEVPAERVHGDSYEAASERDPSGFVTALGITAVLLALGIFGLLTGFAQPRRSSLRAVADSLPAPKVTGPALLTLAAGGILTVIVSSVL